MNLSRNCTTTNIDGWQKYAYITALVPLLTLSVIAMIANCFVIIKFCRLKRNFTVNMKLTFSLAVADFWVSCLMFSTLIGNIVPIIVARNVADLSCFILTLEALKLSAILTSILHLLLLSANQCFSIINPFAHKILITSSICKLTLIFIWTIPAFSFFLYFYSIPDQGYRSYRCINLSPYHMRPFRTIVFCMIALPMFLMINAYAVIWIYINKSTTISRWTNVSFVRQKRTATKFSKRQIQTIITTILIVGTFVFSWFPSILFYLMVCKDCFYQLKDVKPQIIFALGVTKMSLILVKLSLNPFIYSPGIKTMRLLKLNYLRRLNNDAVSFIETFRCDDVNQSNLLLVKGKNVVRSNCQLTLVRDNSTKWTREYPRQRSV